MQKGSFYILVLLGVFLHQSLFAGWVVIEESHDNLGNHRFQTTFIQQNMVRIDGNTTISILNLNKGELTLIFPQHRIFWKGTPRELKHQTNQLMKQQLQMLLLRAPVNQKDTLRKIIRKMDSSDMFPDSSAAVPVVQFQKTGKVQQIGDFKTFEYSIRLDSVLLKETLWVTFDKKPYGETDVSKLLLFTRSMNPQSRENMISHTSGYANLLKSGLIVKSIVYLPQGVKQITQLKKVKQMAISPELFMPPKSYRPASIEEIMQLDMNAPVPGKNNPWDDQNNDDGFPSFPEKSVVKKQPKF